jgi:hypothetical protein
MPQKFFTFTKVHYICFVKLLIFKTNKMKKVVFSLALLLAMSVSFVSCKKAEAEAVEVVEEVAAPVEEAVEEAEEVTEEAAEAVSEEAAAE